MDINQLFGLDKLLKPVDNLLLSINENKVVLLLILILLGIYATTFNEYVTEKAIDLFDNNIFRLIIFVIISYIGSSNPAISISLAIIMLVSLQIITGLKYRKEFSKENFKQIEPLDLDYENNSYLSNPLKMQKNLSPPINFNLDLTTPNDIYINMLKEGQKILDDSYELDNDLKNRYDIREQNISNILKHDGNNLVESGINRLQKADSGEYDYFNKNPKFNKFIEYEKLLESNYNSNIIAIYYKLLNNYKLLVSKNLDINNFNIQLNKVYSNELELLENIYKNKKESLSQNKQDIINSKINRIKYLKNNNKKWYNELQNLFIILQ